MVRPHKKNKGKFVSDEGVNREYVRIAEEEGWTNIPIPQSQRGRKLSDRQIAEKFTKGTHPIFTTDTLAYALTEKELKNSGYILHKTPPKEQEAVYRNQVRHFFKTFTEKHTHGVRWIIEYSGTPTKTQLHKRRIP